MMCPTSSSKTWPESSSSHITRARFESFEEFQEFVRSMFIEGSAIDPELFEACVEFHQDIECDYGGEVVAPIHEALDWDYKRFRHRGVSSIRAENRDKLCYRKKGRGQRADGRRRKK